MESQLIVLVKSLCENFENELKEAFKFCEGLKVSKHQYEGKIIYPNMAKEFIAYLDMQGFFTNQKCFILTDNIKNKDRLLYLTAVLNSKANFWYFKQIGATLGASGYEMSKIFVERLPVIEADKIDSTLLKEIENLASEILESKEADSNSSVADLESRLDSLVYKAYGLNDNEINLIESELSTRERERERTEIIENLYRLWQNFTQNSNTQYQGKIIWAEMTDTPCFVYDTQGFYINQTCYFIPRDDVYLCAILNSKLIYFYMRQIASNLGDGAFRWIKQFIEKLPIIESSEKNTIKIAQIKALAMKIIETKAKNTEIKDLESKLDSMIYDLYHLDESEISLIESTFANGGGR